MKAPTKVAILALVLGGAAAALAWPRINDVQTGHTPEYPDLVPKRYAASPEKVDQAAKKVLGRLPRWSVVGSGKGAGGHAIQAVHETAVWHFKDDVTIQIDRKGDRT